MPQQPRQPLPPAGPRVVPDPSHARPCDLRTDLYVLQPDRLNSSGQNNPLKVCVHHLIVLFIWIFIVFYL